MSTYKNGEVVKVQLTFSDGTVRTLEGEAASEWGVVVAGQGVMAFIHGMPCEEFAWVDTKNEKSEESK
jgi:hypothetical protein